MGCDIILKICQVSDDSSNWFKRGFKATLAVHLCSTGFVLWSVWSWFKTKREPVDLVTDDYDVSLCQQIGKWNNQYDVTIYCDVNIDWCSFLLPLILVGLTRLSQTGSRSWSSSLSLFRFHGLFFLMWMASRTFLGGFLALFQEPQCNLQKLEN